MAPPTAATSPPPQSSLSHQDNNATIPEIVVPGSPSGSILDALLSKTYTPSATPPSTPHSPPPSLRQTQHSSIARSVMSAPPTAVQMMREGSAGAHLGVPVPSGIGSGSCRTDTPLSTAPNSPRIRATTIDVPGLTKSKVSPDGRIAERDLGAKLVIVMVGLPARGKSYVTKKLARYLNWLQHDTKIFNVGNRRRQAAGARDYSANGTGKEDHEQHKSDEQSNHGTGLLSASTFASLGPPARSGGNHKRHLSIGAGIQGGIDQSAAFFDPENKAAAELREKVALETLDELLNYVIHEGGSIGILDATNSTRRRRKAIIDRIREVAGKELGVIFLESECHDDKLLEANMRLKLQGPDYKETDPEAALADFRKRVALYEQSYVSLGDYEEKQGMAYIKMIDVGRKVVTHQIRGFLAAQTVYFLLNFHLSPRQIWITRHGESLDNVSGKIGGDAGLSQQGERYAKALAGFMEYQRKHFHQRQLIKHESIHLPPRLGDTTPPNPEYSSLCSEDEDGRPLEKNFCVWTSMLQRSIQTTKFFDDEEYDIKQMRMLNELNAGIAEGMTYEEIRNKWPDQYAQRRRDKLRYRYPGAGGESYLDVVNRLRAVIVEVERMQDHVLLVAHRVVARVLLAYFLGLRREDVACLDVPLGTLYMLEPKPYGVEFKVYRYNDKTQWFDYLENFRLKDEEQKDVMISR